MLEAVTMELKRFYKDPRAMSKKLYLYSHNGGDFDMKVMLARIVELHKKHSNRGLLPTIIADSDFSIYQLKTNYDQFIVH